jgi:CRP-like cAMP-binding protein
VVESRYALHRTELLGSLEEGERKIIALLKGSSYPLSAEALLVKAGEDHPYVYRLLQGWAGRARVLPDGRKQFILIFLPGDLFAVKSMFVAHHPDDIVAISDIVVERLNHRKLHSAYIGDGDIATRCIWQVIEEERRLHTWVVGLGQGSAEERVALLLIDFRGRLILSGDIPPDSLTYIMPLTQAQMADHLGMTPVHVNRVLKGLRDRNIVSISGGRVGISNLDALAGAAAALLDPGELHTSAYVGRRLGNA